MQQRSGWFLAVLVIILLVVTVGLFPGDCLTRLKVPSGSVENSFWDPVTTCKTLSGIEWPGRSAGIRAVLLIDAGLLLIALVIQLVRRRKWAN